MKNFLINLFYFSIIPLALVLLCLLVYKTQVNNLNINKSINILILGDSHTQTGLDDSLIANSINISQSSEHFLYTYGVLKQLIKNNKHIKTIILGVSFHSFSSSYDELIKNEKQTKLMYPKYFTILDKEIKKDIATPGLNQVFNIYKKSINPQQLLLNFESLFNYPFIGSYYKSQASNLNDSMINVTVKRHFYSNGGKEQEIAMSQIKYLQKIMEFCNDKNLKLIIINTPINSQYFKKIPTKFIDNYYVRIYNLNNTEFFDFHSLSFPRDNYGDGDHLNSKGAKIFTSILKEKIKQ